MWSHTIQSSRPKAPVTSNEKAAKPKAVARSEKTSSLDATQTDDMTQGFDVDGFSKTSHVRPSKKPLTVAKAPVLGRTTSTKADQPPTTPKEDARPSLEKRTSRATPIPPAKGVTPARANKTGTPTSSATRPRAPVLSSRTRTPTQGTAASRAGTPVAGRPSIRSPPKATSTPKGRVNTSKPLPKARISISEHDQDLETKAVDIAETEGEVVSAVDTEGTRGSTEGEERILTLQEDQRDQKSETPVGDDAAGSSYTQSPKDKGGTREDANIEANERLRRELDLRDKVIDSLRNELQRSQSSHKQELEESNSKSTAQEKALRSELDSVRGTLMDLEDTHRSTLEKHDSLLRSRDKIIQNLSEEAGTLRPKSWEDAIVKGEAADKVERRPSATEPRTSQNDVSLSKDEEIQSLSEIIQDLRKQLEAADTARAKEIYDELLRSKDKEIASVSGVVQDLKGELKASDTPKERENHRQLLQSKEKEIKSLSKSVKDLQEKLEANDKAKELSLRGEFQDLQNKHKRKIEDLEASATVRVEALQSDYDELLRSRDQEIKDMTAMAQVLQTEIVTVQEDKRQTLDNLDKKYEQASQDASVRFDSELHSAKMQHEHELEASRAAYQELESKHLSEIQEMTRKHKSEVESARADQQASDTDHQQQLRELRRKHELALENYKREAYDEAHDKITILERKIEDVNTEHERHVEQIEAKHLAEIERTISDHEQATKDITLQHERKLEEANVRYQKELADVERVRGQGSDEISQKHEDQLEVIAKKYQNELDEAARKYDSTVSNHEQLLEKAKADHEDISLKMNKYRLELEESYPKHDALEQEKRMQHEEVLKKNSVHDDELKAIKTEHQRNMNEATLKHDGLKELIEEQKREHQERVSALEHEVEVARRASSTTAAEVASLKATLEETLLSRSRLEEDMKLAHQQELRDAGSKYEHNAGNLSAELRAAAAEIMALKSELKNSDDGKSRAIEDAATKHEHVIRDITSGHEQTIASLRKEHDKSLAEVVAVQVKMENSRQRRSEENILLKDTLRETDSMRNEAIVELALFKDRFELASRENNKYKDRIRVLEDDLEKLRHNLGQSTKDINDHKREVDIEATLQKDKLELAARENHQCKETIAALQRDTEDLQVRLTESSEDLDRERKEAAVEIALLKDKLELAELQRQSASEDMSLAQNEANVEIALLKDRLELSDLQSQQDKKTISALEKRLQEVQAKPPDIKPFIHHQLRDELAMLARHHAANVADVEALKASILAERERREEEWRKRALSRDHLQKEMQGMRAELNGITGVH